MSGQHALCMYVHSLFGINFLIVSLGCHPTRGSHQQGVSEPRSEVARLRSRATNYRARSIEPPVLFNVNPR